ncbi:MAG TPA: hypothetical protein VJ729_10720 [Nitrososphaeraceae archaeon]|nr:hypothetical protein [Nitrososphaeraceae archaeon]
MSNDNKDKKRDIPPSETDTSPIEVTATTTNVGDKDKKILDTGDISRASIAKGIRSPDDGGLTAADVVKGTAKPEEPPHQNQEVSTRMTYTRQMRMVQGI